MRILVFLNKGNSNMSGIVNFIKTPKFFLHFFLSIFSVVAIVLLIFKWLAVYTKHGETVTVPEFKNKNYSEISKIAEDAGVQALIIDSIYNPDEKAGQIFKQEPEFNEKVKEGRQIYLYMYSMKPPVIEMPKLVDKSLRQATAMINSYGLKLNKVTETYGYCQGCVLKQLYMGKSIAVGEKIKKGSKIDLVVGKEQVGFTGEQDTTLPSAPIPEDNEGGEEN
jgi:eukaryotic-like serine/threonine-protein kinase